MFEDDVVTTASNDLIDGSMATDALEPSPSHSPAAPANGHAQARMQEINQLINDLEAATQATNANVTILRGKLTVSQQQLEEKKAELVDLREEAERSLQQLQVTQAQLEENVFSLKEAKEENELLLSQLHQVQEELEVIFLEGQEKDAKLARLVDLADKLDIASNDLNTLKNYSSLQANIFVQHKKCALAGYDACKQSLTNKILRKIIFLTYSN